ncbi:hypothetical protein SP19_141 [Salmonella phage 19]|nr:hypothetical protein SP19_141 [Salmonella phage 19]
MSTAVACSRLDYKDESPRAASMLFSLSYRLWCAEFRFHAENAQAELLQDHSR